MRRHLGNTRLGCGGRREVQGAGCHGSAATQQLVHFLDDRLPVPLKRDLFAVHGHQLELSYLLAGAKIVMRPAGFLAQNGGGTIPDIQQAVEDRQRRHGLRRRRRRRFYNHRRIAILREQHLLRDIDVVCGLERLGAA